MADRAVVQGLLERIRDAPEGQGLPTVKELFSYLGYEYLDAPLRPDDWSKGAKRAVAPGQEPRTLFRSGEFQIAYVPLRALRISVDERPVMSHLLKQTPYLLAVFSDPEGRHWHFVNAKWDDEPKRRRLFRRISVGPGDRLRTASERLFLIEAPEGISLLDLKGLHDKAFDVQEVTDIFYRAYEQVFRGLQYDLEEQTNDATWAHDFALQFLNRLMFLYFVQRKRWLGEDPEFLGRFWKEYRASGRPKDTFVKEWLYVLFFRAFNNRFSPVGYFPKETNEILQLAPYLNGGLFLPNPDLDDKYSFLISDEMFREVFSLLEGYNFTIREDSPLDQEVAVDPEMLGRVYESLVNVSAEADERGQAGIFYTPRTEIDLMCRLALVDYLTNHLGESRKSLLYESVFSFEPEDKQHADLALERENLWPDLDRLLRDVKVVDPACGSASFLVAMLFVLGDLRKRANKVLGTYETDYELKKEIIGENLYGVDVMRWAVDVAELRLWLQLVVESDLSQPERIIRPLLPHLSFKIRQGDSLVQEVGGINLSLREMRGDIPAPLKGKLTRLKGEKRDFYENPLGRYQPAKKEAIEQKELLIFREILAAKGRGLANKIKGLKQRLETRQADLEGRVVLGLEPGEAKRRKLELEVVESQLERVRQARQALRTVKDVPFVWDIAFVEVFLPDKQGFDIVIGNPPYVRQERIADPQEPKEQVTPEKKRAYKRKLARSVYAAFPTYFGYDASKDKVVKKLGAKSDLYIYFYFHGLSLLNPKGSFCFITSNSWLDVGYGKDLQEFLLKHSHVKFVLDNQVKRSFARADINTVIVLFSAPDAKREWGLEKTARFVMFKVPFEQVLDPVIVEEIEEAEERLTRPEYRVTPMPQGELLEEGLEGPTEKERRTTGPLIKVARYIGDKWGGKYLRAPDIYFTILEKGKGKLVRLGDIAQVRRGFTTGANEFFYLDEGRIKERGIENEFLRPIIKSPRECKSILVKPEDLKYKVFMCHKEKSELKGTSALDYIEWGQSQGYHRRPTCRSRPRWWDLGARNALEFCIIKGPWLRHFIPVNRAAALCDQQIYEVELDPDCPGEVPYIANCTLSSLIFELEGRTNFGEGILWIAVYEAEKLLLPDLAGAPPSVKRELHARFEMLAARPVMEIFDELSQPDHRALDDIAFAMLGLTTGEREAVYEAVINLVEARMEKAKSV